MRERLDCAVLLTECTVAWAEAILGQHAGGRLHLHALDEIVKIDAEGSTQVLSGMNMALRRFDACILPVSPASLSWARISLSQGLGRLHTPVIVLAHELSTAGLYDLHQLGVAEFLRTPFCSHEARLRIERLLDERRSLKTSHEPGHMVSEAGQSAALSRGERHPYSMVATEDTHGDLEAYAIAAASRSSSASESFQEAKRRVIERFERAYINAALGRHGGNIAMAARAAKKHRRAFWALMRKHEISAEPYRLRGLEFSTRCRAIAAERAQTGHA